MQQKVLPLLQGLQACPSWKMNYSQLFMHVTIDFYAAMSKLWLLRQPLGRHCKADFFRKGNIIY